MSFNFGILRRSKFWKRCVAALCSILVLLVLGWWLLPVNQLLAQQLHAWLAAQGIAAEFNLSGLNASHASLRHIRLRNSDALSVDALDVSYSAGGLLQGRIDTLSLSGLRVTLRHDDSGALKVEGLPWPAEPSTQGASPLLPALPFKQLRVEDAQVLYHAPTGEVITASGALNLHQNYTGKLSITQASLPLADGEVLLTGLHMERAEPAQPFSITLENLAHITGKKPYFSPLSGKGEIMLARDSGAIEGRINIHDLRDLWTLNVTADAQPLTGEWKIVFEQPEITFESGIIQPDMLFPVLRGVVQQASGSISFGGTIRSTATGVVQSEGNITLANIGANAGPIAASGVQGTVKLTSLWPPVTAGEQSVAIDEIIMGLPLRQGTMRFRLDSDGTAHLKPSEWQWAQGSLHTGSVAFNIHSATLPDITLTAKSLALEELLSGLLKEGISATGRLDGRIPVVFTKEGEAMIRNGTLTTQGGGTVRYTPTAESPLQKGGSLQTDILLGALENFHYEQLDITINSTTTNELEVAMHVKGRNPELYDGQTIELNINLSGNLFDVIQSGMSIYSLPERLEEQLLQ
jgi:hypothetical protein